MITKLKEKRIKAGLTQEQLAEETGIKVGVLRHYEQGSRSFDSARIDTILKTCLILHCKLEDILENQEYVELLKQYKKSSL